MKNIIYIIVLFLVVTSNAQTTLKGYLEIAERNNPELQASKYKYESTLEKINEVGSLPNTSIGFGYFVQEAETRVGAQKIKISISQKLPWFGTLKAREQSVMFKANAKQNEIDIIKKNLFLKVKKIYFELFELKAKRNVLGKNIVILNTFENLALIELENNKSTMIDVLKIRMEKNEIQNNIDTIDQRLKSKSIAFNLILNIDESSPINITEQVMIANTHELFSKIDISNNPRLLKLDNLNSSLKKSELATKKEGMPIIGLALDYILIDERTDMPNLVDNGKDVIMPMVTVSIPLFSEKYSSKQKQLRLDQKSIESTRVGTVNKLYSVFEKAKRSAISAKNTIKTQMKNIGEADMAKEILLAAYENSKVDFEQLLEIQQLELKFQFKKITSERNYYIQVSILEFLTINN